MPRPPGTNQLWTAGRRYPAPELQGFEPYPQPSWSLILGFSWGVMGMGTAAGLGWSAAEGDEACWGTGRRCKSNGKPQVTT